MSTGQTIQIPGSTGAGGDAYTWANKLTTETRNSTTTLADDAELVHASLPAGLYAFRGKIFFNIANATMDFKWALVTTGTVTAFVANRRASPANANAGTDNEETRVTENTTGTTLGAFTVVGSTFGEGMVEFEGYIVLTGAGDLAFQWAQNTSDPANCQVKNGSIFGIRLLA